MANFSTEFTRFNVAICYRYGNFPQQFMVQILIFSPPRNSNMVVLETPTDKFWKIV